MTDGTGKGRLSPTAWRALIVLAVAAVVFVFTRPPPPESWSWVWIGKKLWNMPGGIGALFGAFFGLGAVALAAHVGSKNLIAAQEHQADLARQAHEAQIAEDRKILAAGVLAILALVALRGGWGAALPLVWLFNVVGTVDLFYAVGRGITVDAVQNLGAAWYIPTFIVPVLLVTHFMVFARLLRAKSDVL